MRYEVWTQQPDYDTQTVIMFPALHHDNERELIEKGFRVSHVFEADTDEEARDKLAKWVATDSMEKLGRQCDGHPAWECTDECRTRGLPPPARHPIEARMADEKFGPPRKTPGTLPFDDDVRKAIEKHRNPTGGAMLKGDATYMTALEDENAELMGRVKSLEEKMLALVNRNAEWAELSESLGWYDPPEVKALIDIRTKAAAAALDAIERGSKVIEALMPGLRHIAVQNYQEVNEAPIAMAKAADALREALGVQRPENVSEADTEIRPKE